MPIWRVIWISCLVLLVSQHAGAQSGATASIVQDVNTNRCRIVAHKATTNAEQTVLGEFASFAEANSRLKQILICQNIRGDKGEAGFLFRYFLAAIERQGPIPKSTQGRLTMERSTRR